MKKEEYIKANQRKLDEGHALYMSTKMKDVDGDAIYRTFPTWIGDTALSAGWVKVSTTQPVGVDVFQKNEVADDVIEKEYTEGFTEPKPQTRATKGALEFAEEQGIDISEIQGTGRAGKVTLFDVKNFIENG